jgi:hypothetical protein
MSRFPSMPAVYVPVPRALKPGEWNFDETEDTDPVTFQPITRKEVNFCLPNGVRGVTDSRWVLANPEPAHITVTPSIWAHGGRGPENGEWHGYLTNGQWVGC